MKKSLLSVVVFVLVLQIYGMGQTKSIYIKRNNISSHLFSNTAIPSNLGVAPERWVKHARLEKVIRIDDTTAVMVTENECEDVYSGSREKWRAGKDTVVHHPVFNGELTVPEMRTKLDNDYYFANKASTVKFEGFDSTCTSAQKAVLEPKKISEHARHFKAPKINKWLILLVVISASAGLTRIK